MIDRDNGRMTSNQLRLFGSGPALPDGFKYQPDIMTPAAEQSLLQRIEDLPLREVEFHGYIAKRRVISYGWQYDFTKGTLRKTEDIPPFLLPLRELTAGFAGISADELQQVFVTEYDAGVGIGWHRDKAVFGDVIGISLLSSCHFRMRRKIGTAWERASITADARSIYLLRGPSRTEWEHSIPAVESRRYSITFRNFREAP